MRLSTCALNANTAPETMPADHEPVHDLITRHIAQPLNAKPAMSSRLDASTGEAPATNSGNAMAACGSIGSE